MKRFFCLAALLVLGFFVGVRPASADFILIKINLNQLNLIPPPPPMPKGGGMTGQPPPNMGGGFGQRGGGFPMPPPQGGNGGAQGGNGGMPPMPPPDPNARWISAFVEMRYKEQKPMLTPYGPVFTYDHNYDHKWGGLSNWMVASPSFPLFGGFAPSDSFTKEFGIKFAAETRGKDRNVKRLLTLARWTLSRGHLVEFHKVMAEAVKADEKHPNVVDYLRVKKGLQEPFKDEDPAQTEILRGHLDKGYKKYDSDRKQYRIYAMIDSRDKQTKAVIDRRLALMEDTLDTFYYWFAVQEEPELQKVKARPKLPKYRLNAILTVSGVTGEEFKIKQKEWGDPPLVSDGFTTRRDNLIVMASKVGHGDPLLTEFESVLKDRLRLATQKMEREKLDVTFNRDDLLNGNLSSLTRTPHAKAAVVYIAAAQTAVLLAKTLEDDAERYTVTNASIRQLLIASEMFPRNVQIPDWMVEGLAALLETPPGALYPTIGSASWTHLISFKHFLNAKRFGDPPHTAEVLQSVVTDRYFTDARQQSKEANERQNDPDRQKTAKEAWELARCTSWAYVYYLAKIGKLHYLFRYGNELDKLPRDMDLNELVLQGAYAKAFDMTDRGDARQIDPIAKEREGNAWFELLKGANLDLHGDLRGVQAYYEKKRSKIDDTGKPPPNDPNSTSPQPSPLVGTTWNGMEGFNGKQQKVSFQFTAAGKVTMNNAVQGTWSQTGNTVTMKFNNDSATYTGTMTGNQMQGTMTNTMNVSWNWSAASGPAPNQPPPPPPFDPKNPKKGPRG